MKALPFRIPKTGDPTILTQIDDGPHFYDILHKHPEFQITLIVKGKGTLICDEYLGRFNPGDVVMFGPNQPHVLKCDEEYYQNDLNKEVYAASIFFNYNILEKGLLTMEELEDLNVFLEKGKCGLKFSSNISSKAAQILSKAPGLKNLDLIIEFLHLLRYLMADKHFDKFSHSQRSMNEIEGNRMKNIMEYTLRNFRKHITIDEIAEVANMSPNAFCKYFKSRTRKTYLTYLNELRISYACRQLRENTLSVSQVAHQSGFQNLSHFNRCFKKITGVTPGKYGRKMNQISDVD